MNKKGSALSWILTIIGILILLGLLVALIIVTNQQEEEQELEKTMTIYLSSKDADLKKSTNIDYQIYSNLSKGIVFNGKIQRNIKTQIENISKSDNLTISCGGQGYYHTLINKSFSPIEIQQNISQIECPVYKIGKLTAKTKDNLSIGEQTITINVSSEAKTQSLSFCVSWTSGIISLDTSYEKIDKPKRISKIVDKCYKTNEDLKDNSTLIKINIKSEVIEPKDKLTIYFFDEDYYFDNEFKLMSEYENNLGSNNDYIFEVN